VVLGVGSALPGLAAVGFFEAELKAAAVSQALVARGVDVARSGVQAVNRPAR
jgi:hypothetical protein